MFQSSPVPKDGCNPVGWSSASPGAWFQSSPVPKDGCNWGCRQLLASWNSCFNPHPSRRTGATASQGLTSRRWEVSILTRPEGRVQRVEAYLWRPEDWVSILTRPEGRVQRDVSQREQASRRRFNPHPSRRTGATRIRVHVATHAAKFQSSPVPKDGCNEYNGTSWTDGSNVSILTRPEGRVQQCYIVWRVVCVVVSILTRPEGRVQLDAI